MTLTLLVTVTEMVEVDVEFPVYVNFCGTVYKYIDENTCIEVEHHVHINCYSVRVWDKWPDHIKRYLRDGKRICSGEFDVAFAKAFRVVDSAANDIDFDLPSGDAEVALIESDDLPF
jgi:hypothetical protein